MFYEVTIMIMSVLRAETEGRVYIANAANQGTTSIEDLLKHVEPEIATALDKAGAKVYVMRFEVFSNIENFLNFLSVGYGDEVIVVVSVNNTSALPTITRTIMAKGATVRRFVSYKLPAYTFVLGIVKRPGF